MIDTPALPATEREFHFTPADFGRIRTLIYQHAGISLHEGKQAMVYSRVSRRLRATGHRTFGSYLNWLEQQARSDEWQEFVNCLTTNLTSFFREEHHFRLLMSDLPALAQAKRGGGSVRIWCSASSTGEEPYSIAMTAVEALGANPPVEILASDIDTRVLDKASTGIYDIDSKGLSPERLKAHFLRGSGAHEGLIRVKPSVARLVSFMPLNLMHDGWSLGAPFDIVFCRNVMIYFDPPTQRKVLQRIHSVMNPGGLLVVGHSENFGDARDLFGFRGKTVYQRR